MSITISFDPAIQAELEAEASARAISCEQVICEAVGNYLQRAKSPNPAYEAWFMARVAEGLAEASQGKFAFNEEAKRRAKARRKRLLRKISGH